MPIMTGAPDSATERPFTSGGIGWLASSSFGPRISFAPEGLGGGASSGDAGGADAGGDAAGEPSQPESTRDAVLAAFEKLEKGDEQQPTDANAQKPMTADARARDQHGRFAAAQEEGKQQPASEGQQPAPEAKDQPTEEGKQAARAAPPGWSPQSKEAFNSLPEFVKTDIAKREQDVNQGLSELRDYRDLRPFRDMAQRSGTTLPAVLSEVTKMEETLQSNPVAAIGALSQMYGFDIRQVVTGLAGALGMQIGQQPAGEQQFPQPTQQQPLALPQEVLERLARVDRLEAHIQGQAQTQMKSAIQSFADDPTNEFFENVGSEISQIIASDIDRFRSMPPHLAVKEAYDKAVWLNPDTRAVLIKRQAEAEGRAATERMQATAHQARQAAKGLSGTPVNGATPGSRPPAPQSTRDAVAQAWDMHADL